MSDARPGEDQLPFYLDGLHAPIEHEVEAFDLPVEGTIPPELAGLYVRNGPNPLGRDPGHWFLGDGMLHAVELQGGRARSFRSRFVRNRKLRGLARYVDAEGRVDYTASPANTHVVAHAGRILALAENGYPWLVDRQLDTIGYHDFAGRLRGPMTAHPKLCPTTGELHFFGYHFAPPFVVYHRVDAKGELVFSRPIEIPRPIMMHDFAITRDFVLFFDLPLVFSPEALARGGMPYAFEATAGARIGLLRRDAPEAPVRWLEIEPCFFFHPVNAWNDAASIRIDVARYPDLWREDSGRFGSAYLHRYEIDRARIDGGGAVCETALDDLGIEFPRIREDRVGLPNRFGYAAQTRDDGIVVGAGLVRYDLETGARSLFDGEGRWMPGEPVFAPAGDGEGEGWLLTYLHDRDGGPSRFAVFDATRLEKGPIAQVRLPQRVPLGFHGSWIPDEAIAR
ncbi:MAG: carotenoid oxygenase family protein [Myxococcota bacterium]